MNQLYKYFRWSILLGLVACTSEPNKENTPIIEVKDSSITIIDSEYPKEDSLQQFVTYINELSVGSGSDIIWDEEDEQYVLDQDMEIVDEEYDLEIEDEQHIYTNLDLSGTSLTYVTYHHYYWLPSSVPTIMYVYELEYEDKYSLDELYDEDGNYNYELAEQDDGEFFDAWDDDDFYFEIYQKRQGKWENRTANLLPEDYKTQAQQYFPNILSEEGMMQDSFAANERMYSSYFGTVNTLDFFHSKDEISYSVGPSYTFSMRWNGRQFEWAKMPSLVFGEGRVAERTYCYNSGKFYAFTGNIDNNPIELTLSFDDKNSEDEVRLEGKYWYESSGEKMSINGHRDNNLIWINRIDDNGNIREKFVGEIVEREGECGIEGTWEHQERKGEKSFLFIEKQ